MNSAKTQLSVAIAGVSLAITLAGCSGGSSSSSTSASAASGSAGVSASASAASTAFTPDVQAQLQKALDEVRVKFKAPGVLAGVWTNNGEWIGISGVAKAGTTQPPTPDDHTRIGSITKTMTATVILQLIEAGKLSFDDVVDKYVPGMPNGSTATIKNLLEMQSGIPSYTADAANVNVWAADPTKAFTPQQLVDSVKTTPAMFAPGTNMFYSNTNYVLLGMIIEKVTGRPIVENFSERLFKPLGMNQSSVPGTSTDLPSPYWSGISTQADPNGTIKNATNWNPSFAFTAGEVISTLDDLHTWGVALGTGKGILKPETQQLRVDSVKSTVGMNTPDYSYGMGVVNLNGWLGHTGEIPGYNTILNYQPATGTTVVVMVNSDITVPANPTPEVPRPAAPAVAGFEGIAKVLSAAGSASPSPSAS